MIGCLEMLDRMPPRAVATTAKSRTHDAYPDILTVLTLITLDIHGLGFLPINEV